MPNNDSQSEGQLLGKSLFSKGHVKLALFFEIPLCSEKVERKNQCSHKSLPYCSLNKL